MEREGTEHHLGEKGKERERETHPKSKKGRLSLENQTALSKAMKLHLLEKFRRKSHLKRKELLHLGEKGRERVAGKGTKCAIDKGKTNRVPQKTSSREEKMEKALSKRGENETSTLKNVE